MTVNDLIKELSKFDKNEQVFCLYKTIDYRYNGEYSEEVDTCDWCEIEGIKIREYGGETQICIYGDESDTEV